MTQTPREVIANIGRESIMWSTDRDYEGRRAVVGFDADAFLSALTAADYVLLPREPSRKMWAASGNALLKDGRERRSHHDHISTLVWDAMLTGAEVEAKGGEYADHQ